MVDGILAKTTKRRAPARRRLYATARQAHAYGGLVLSALLFVIAFSGALLVFKDDYLRATMPAARAHADLSVDGLARVVSAAEATYADQARAIVFAGPHLGVHKLYLDGGRAAYLDADGAVVAAWERNERVEDWLFDLHHQLLLDRTGLAIAGVAALALAALIVGGLIAYWPARRGWRRGLRAAGPSRIELLSVHRNLGTYVALPSLIVALSGAALAFPSTSRALFDQFGGPRATPLETPAPAFKPARSVDWSNALAAATRAFPDASPRIVVWPRGERGAQIRLRRPGEWHPNGRTRVVFDPATGAATLYENAMAQGAGRRAYNALYPVHAAHVGGRVYDAVVFLTGTGLSVLGVLGVLAFAKRTRPQAPTPERRTVTSDRIKNGSGAQNKESRASDGCNKKAPTP